MLTDFDQILAASPKEEIFRSPRKSLEFTGSLLCVVWSCSHPCWSLGATLPTVNAIMTRDNNIGNCSLTSFTNTRDSRCCDRSWWCSHSKHCFISDHTIYFELLSCRTLPHVESALNIWSRSDRMVAYRLSGALELRFNSALKHEREKYDQKRHSVYRDKINNSVMNNSIVVGGSRSFWTSESSLVTKLANN